MFNLSFQVGHAKCKMNPNLKKWTLTQKLTLTLTLLSIKYLVSTCQLWIFNVKLWEGFVNLKLGKNPKHSQVGINLGVLECFKLLGQKCK